MKAKHRHELKTNELAEWLANLPQWAKENLRTIIYVSVVIVVVVGLYAWKSYARNVLAARVRQGFTRLVVDLSQTRLRALDPRFAGQDLSVPLFDIARELQASSGKWNDQTMAALGFIKRAEALRAELHYRQTEISKSEVEDRIALAKDSYNTAIAKAPDNLVLVGAAKFGLGLCAEELGDFEQAEKIYKELTSDPQFEYTVAAAQAQIRLKTMADYKEPVTFVKPPKLKPAAAPAQPTPPPTAPATPAVPVIPPAEDAIIDLSELGFGDSNLPAQ